jgi:hypothetical protein
VLLSAGLRALQIVLVLGCLGMLASGISAAFGGNPPEAFEIPAALPPAAVDRSFERNAVIESRDLFATHKPTEAEGAIVEEELPPSKAEWRLIGTIAMSDAKLGVATLEHKRTRGLRGAWRAGEDIEPGLTLVRIEARRVVVRRDGRHEQIPMDDDKGPLASAAPVQAAPGMPSAAERRDAARQERIDQMAEQREQQRLQELRMQAEAEAAAQAAAQAAAAPMPGQARLETLMNSLRMTPVQDENGELQDIVVEPNPDMADNPFSNLAAGTKCHKLNGIPMSRMHEAIATLSDDQQACLECTAPDGSPQTICY